MHRIPLQNRANLTGYHVAGVIVQGRCFVKKFPDGITGFELSNRFKCRERQWVGAKINRQKQLPTREFFRNKGPCTITD